MATFAKNPPAPRPRPTATPDGRWPYPVRRAPERPVRVKRGQRAR